MESEGGSVPLDPALEDRLVHGVLTEIRLQRRRRVQRWAGAGVALAMAAGLVLVLWPRGPHMLPAYELEVSGNQATLGPKRPDTSAPAVTRLAPDSILDITLRPRKGYGGPLKVVAFLRPDDYRFGGAIRCSISLRTRSTARDSDA
jgi:hypothetical protein